MKKAATGRQIAFLKRAGILLYALVVFAVGQPVGSVAAEELSDTVGTELSNALSALGLDNLAIDLNVRIPMTEEENPVGYDCDLWATVIRHTSVDEETGLVQRPTLLLATAYRREIMGPMRLLAFLQHGYNIMMADMRGTGSGEGVWGALDPIEQYDVAYLIDHWIPGQSWSNGKVGMMGGSYEGIIQYLASGLVEQEYSPEKGEMVPKHLKAITPLSAFSDTYRDIVMHGGNFDMEFMSIWIVLTDLLSVFPPDLMLGYCTESGINLADIQAAADIWQTHIDQLGVPIEWIMDPDHELKTEWYELKSPMLYWPQKPAGGWSFGADIPAEVGGNTIPKNLPVFTATGWFDIFTRGALDNYHYGLAEHSSADKAMIVGPWYHIDAAMTVPGVPGLGLIGEEGLLTWEVLVRWFDWKIKGKDDPFMEEFPVALYVMGEDRWRAEKSWPLPESRLEDKTYYLSKKKASLILGDLFSLSNQTNNYQLVSEPANSDYYDSFLWFKWPKTDPVLDHDPSNLHGLTSRSAQRWLGFSPLTIVTQTLKYELGISSDDLIFWEDEREDENGVLTFTTPALTEDIEISGPLKLTFWASTEFTDELTQVKIDALLDTIADQFDIGDNENMILELADRADVQWVVEVNDVFPAGRAKNITSGWLSAAHRPYDPADPTQVDPDYVAFDPFYNYADKNPDPIAEDTVYQYVIEIWPTTNVFLKGHRVRVSISASDFPHLFPVLRPSSNTIVLDEDHQARLDFKVVNQNGQGVTWKWIDDIGDYLLREK